MKCPICNGEFSIADFKERNMELYRNSIVARTECCNKLVHCRPKFSYYVQEYDGTRTEDDWGE